MLSIVSLALATSAPMSQSKILALRGGMSFGPVNGPNFDGSMKVNVARGQTRKCFPCAHAAAGLASVWRVRSTSRHSQNDAPQVVAAITAAGAISSKYADIGDTALTKMFKGGVFDTNLIISMVTGVASTVIYQVGSSGFDAGKLGAVLWLATVLLDLKDKNFDIMSLKDSPVQTGVALGAMYFAFA
jgi:hypothetical protein